MTALDGLRILDMTQYEAGTACTQCLAWLGADVVKVEPPGAGDPGRNLRGMQDYFMVWNSNKRSIALDLRNPQGRELLLQMAPQYDVFIENYGPGVIEKLNLGYEVLSALKPDIIYARIKGFGLDGPWSDYKCFDMVAQAAAGAFSVTGEADGPPMRPGPTTGDSGTGVQMALAIAAAYVQKLKTGQGQLIELSMQEAMTYYMRTHVAGTGFGATAAARSGSGPTPTLRLYPCKGGGPNDYVYIMAVMPRMWEALCRVIGREEFLQDPRFAGDRERFANREVLEANISAWTSTLDKYQAMQLLAQAGVPASAVLDTKDLYDNPHFAARGFIHEVEHPERGRMRLWGWPARMSGSSVPIKAAPRLGEHSAEVLAQDLGLGEAEISRLMAAGAAKGLAEQPAGKSAPLRKRRE